MKETTKTLIRYGLEDVILRYSKTNNVIWNQLYEELSESSIRQWKGKVRIDRTSERGTRFSQTIDKESPGVQMSDVWEISQITASFGEYLAFDTQKPEALLKCIILASSNEGDIVADFFCGSGTTLAVAERLGRRWIGCDLSKFTIQVARKRLLDIYNSKDLMSEK
ncbi:MAG: hypothetical protein DRP87_09980 [Spirochaetes bacterium]|nr:MAG: hypothetical protein DRP87_09980 [Spirochaetota bacterium]